MNKEFRYWLAVTEKASDHGHQIPFTFQVRGCSMFPLIRSGVDDVTMVRWSGELSALKPGVIVFFVCDRVSLGYVLHRIIRRSGNKILTMGDGNLYDDGWTEADKVIGQVVNIRRGRFSFDPGGGFGRLYFILWKMFLPVRHQVLSVIHFCGKVRRRIKGHKQ